VKSAISALRRRSIVARYRFVTPGSSTMTACAQLDHGRIA
jgi:hypothetical protein